MILVYTGEEKAHATQSSNCWEILTRLGTSSEFQVSSAQDVWNESNSAPDEQPRGRSDLQIRILIEVTKHPGLDDVEIADRLGEVPFEISECLHELALKGLIEEAK